MPEAGLLGKLDRGFVILELVYLLKMVLCSRQTNCARYILILSKLTGFLLISHRLSLCFNVLESSFLFPQKCCYGGFSGVGFFRKQLIC